MKHLSLCHTVIKDIHSENSAQSPDELSLVAAAKAFGFEFDGKNQQNNTVRIKTFDNTIKE
jgi:magnesium-transporting ATPase (P-type)